MKFRKLIYNGEEYLLGSAGSLILDCPKCGEEHFRPPITYFNWKDVHRCFKCGSQMIPIKMNEIETRWIPFWNIIDSNNCRKLYKEFYHMWY